MIKDYINALSILIISFPLISTNQSLSLPIIPKLEQGFKCHSLNNTSSPLTQTIQKITKDNFKSITSSLSNYLLYVSASWCDYCCQEERELLFVYNLIKSNSSSITKPIPLFYLLSDEDLSVLIENKIGFFKVPTLYLYHNSKYIQYPHYFTSNSIMTFIRNILSPITILTSESEIDSFLSKDNEIKIITFITNKKEYSEEVEMIKSTIELINYRSQLSFAMVMKGDLIVSLKKTKNGLWFDYHSLNSILLKRFEEYYFLDLSLQNHAIKEFLIYNTLPSVDELSNNNNNIINKISTPIVLFFIDTTYNISNFHNMLRFMNEMSMHYNKKYVFMYMDGGARSKTKEDLGLDKEAKVPTIVINYLSSNKKRKYPIDKPFNEANIKIFLDDNLKLTIKESKERNIKTLSNIKSAVHLTKSNYESIVNNPNYDVIAFIIDSDYDEQSLILSQYVNRLIEKFISFGIKSVIISVYDYSDNEQLLPKNVLVNHIYLYSSKTSHVYSYNGSKLSLFRLMKWVQDNCGIPFNLPDFPHIDYKDIDEYINRRSQMEMSESNKDKSEFEIDDMINLHSDL